MNNYRLLRLPEVMVLSGLSRSSIYLRISLGLFPKRISLGGRSVAWPAKEIEALNAARISGKKDHEIYQLVAEMAESRKFSSTEKINI